MAFRLGPGRAGFLLHRFDADAIHPLALEWVLSAFSRTIAKPIVDFLPPLIGQN